MEGVSPWLLFCILLPFAVSSQQGTHEITRAARDCAKDAGNFRTKTTDRLQRLRKKMNYFSYDAFIITSDDEHQSEYPSEYDKRRQFITGFTGSAGTAVVLKESGAALWTDSRYVIQADREMDCNWNLMPTENRSTPSITEWLALKLEKGARIAADAKLISQEQWEMWSNELTASGLVLLSEATNIIDAIWSAGERPVEPSRKVVIHEIKFAGKSWEDKVTDVRKKLAERNLKGMLVTVLTEVAWLFNLRGSDVPYVPVFKAFAVVTLNHVILYVKKWRITPKLSDHLNEKKCPPENPECIMVDIKDYKDFYKDFSKDLKGLKVIMSPSVSHAIYSTLNKDFITLGMTPVLEEMICKNPVERKGMANAMLKDSVALIAFFAMLESEVQEGRAWSEVKAAEEVQRFRSQQEFYKGESFEAISAVGSHAAMPHYTPKASTNWTIDTHHVYLLDSGGQYLDGTTDITRTLHFGTPTEFQKEAYTRVLMGVISLATLVFPEGTKDSYVDVLSRRALSEAGLTFGHGTGHGVGSYLSVHEFPPAIRPSHAKTEGYPFRPGMFFSIEPGFYLENDFGIRLETIFTVVEAKTKYAYENQTFYTFEPVVWIPFEKKMIKMSLLSKEQEKWLDNYNAKCVTLSGQRLRRARHNQGLDWLMTRAKPMKQWTNSATSSNPFWVIFVFLVLVYSCQ